MGMDAFIEHSSCRATGIPSPAITLQPALPPLLLFLLMPLLKDRFMMLQLQEKPDSPPQPPHYPPASRNPSSP